MRWRVAMVGPSRKAESSGQWRSGMRRLFPPPPPPAGVSIAGESRLERRPMTNEGPVDPGALAQELLEDLKSGRNVPAEAMQLLKKVILSKIDSCPDEAELEQLRV